MYISPVSSFRVVRFIGIIVGNWPMNSKDKKLNLVVNIVWWFRVSNFLFALTPTLLALRENFKDIGEGSYSWLELTFITESIFILIYTRISRSALKVLLLNAERRVFMKKQKFIRKYVSFYTYTYISIVALNVILLTIYLEKPALTDRELFLTASYPFDVKSTLVKNLLYYNQLFILLHAAVIPNLDGIVLVLLFTCLECLKDIQDRFKNAGSFEKLIVCIREHEKALRLIRETNCVVRFLVLKTIACYMSYTLGSGLHVLHKTTLPLWIHQLVFLILVYMRILVCADCAHSVASASDDIAMAVYSTRWYEENPRLMKVKAVIIQRCQKLPVIYVNGVMPALDRRYFGMLIYVTMSYLMTLRAIVNV